MSNAIWTITAGTITKSPAEWGLEIVGGEFRSGSASSVTLRAAVAFDSEPVFASGSDVVILRNSSPFFRGKVRAVPRSADDSDEAQEFVVEDAWADLERTTYQEDWAAGVGSLLLPFAALSSIPPMTSGEFYAQMDKVMCQPTKTYAERRESIRAFRLNPDGGAPIPIPPPTEEQLRSMDEQKERMFTPDGQFRMVVELRDAYQKGLFRPGVGFVEKQSP